MDGWLPDEVWSEVFRLVAVDNAAFTINLDYGQTPAAATRRPLPLEDIASVNKRFYRIAMQVLWRNVVVHNPASLSRTARLSPLHGRLCRRLELRLSCTYDISCLPSILSDMPYLQIYLLRNHLYPRSNLFPVDQESAIDAMCNCCPLLERIQFDSDLEAPTVDHVRRIMNTMSHLLSFRTARLALDRGFLERRQPADTVNPKRQLRSLSVGHTHWTWPPTSSTQELDSFLSLLSVPGTLPHLVELHILQFSPFFPSFLSVIGHQLEHLTLLAPDYHSDSLHDAALISQCANINSLTILVKNASAVDVDRALPAYHPSIRSASIECHSLGLDDDNLFRCAHQMLIFLRDGHFPLLREATLRLTGVTNPLHLHPAWLEEIRLSMLNRSVRVVLHDEYRP